VACLLLARRLSFCGRLFRAEGRKYFFFEKKKQKTFARCTLRWGKSGKFAAARSSQKFFGSFFQKRTASFCYVTGLRRS
jgi:hypothetical protein